MPASLRPKQARFVEEYLIDLNATQAAIRAGYPATSAAAIGNENLTKPAIQAAVAAGKRRQLDAAGLSAARVLEELRRLSTVDVRGFFDAAGNLKPIKDLTAEQGACLASFEVIIKNAKAGDNQTDTIHKIKLWDKVRSLEMLAKHFKLLVDQIEVRHVRPDLGRLSEDELTHLEAMLARVTPAAAESVH